MTERVSPIERAERPRGARAWLAPRDGGARLHAGVDLGRAGDSVRAPEAGQVLIVGRGSLGSRKPRWSQPEGWAGYGPGFVVIEGESGRFHLLAHIGFLVDPGDVVTAGQKIGLVPAVSGHVHWEVRTALRPRGDQATVEITLDPMRWLAGQDIAWDPSAGCPPAPVADRRTPRACRPGGDRRPSPAPSPEPSPEHPTSGAPAEVVGRHG
jgi:murein DD-endopeptidase MepM/ murein hydrolase activator NlpD